MMSANRHADILYAETAAQARQLIEQNCVSNIIIELALPDEGSDALFKLH